MLVSGFVVNNTGRYTHIFKRKVRPGERVPLSELYKQYKLQCKCDFDEQFIGWLKENKIPKKKGWDLEDIQTKFDKPVVVESKVIQIDDEFVSINKEWTAQDIANLKVKDKPKDVLKTVDSITKLRRALTMVNKMKAKTFLVKHIKKRIEELIKENKDD